MQMLNNKTISFDLSSLSPVDSINYSLYSDSYRVIIIAVMEV